MDKFDYIKNLKETDLRPKFRKPQKPSEPVLLHEVKKEKEQVLKEIFIQANEVASLPAGPERDMQILRLSIIAELDASNLYERLAQLADNNVVRQILLDVSQEEKVHVGEFQSILEEIDPEYEDALEEGEEEVEEEIEDEDEEE